MSRLLLIDKDGTLVHPKEDQFVSRPWDQIPFCSVPEALSIYKEWGYKIVIVSNQGGVDKGHKSLDHCFLEMEYCLELFPQIEECFFCPDLEGNRCYRLWKGDFIQYRREDSLIWQLKLEGQFRKPDPGMLLLAKHIYGMPEKCLYVGDRPEDEAAAKAANMPFIWAREWEYAHLS